jgi:hypothetical protein
MLDSIFLPPSIEVIDQTFLEPSAHIPRYFAPGNLHFCMKDDCFLLANGRELIQYRGSLQTFCVNRDITALFRGSFLGNSTLTTLTFEPQSRLKSLSANCFSLCKKLRSVSIPKSVRVIGEYCFEGCSELMEVSFESPSTIHTIKRSAFSNCVLLTDFIVPASVLTLQFGVFSGCSGLSSVTFEAPSQVTDIPLCRHISFVN